MPKRPSKRPETVCFEVPFAAPEGFAWHPRLMATLDEAAKGAGVTTRTVRNWITEWDPPLPAARREGAAPLIDMAVLALWLALRRAKDPDFGEHGGRRR